MFQNKYKYLSIIKSAKLFVESMFLHINRIYKEYIRVIDNDGIFMYTQMGDWQESGMLNYIFIPHIAISCVEQGL